MEDKQNTYWSALAKYFSGNASEEEKNLVQEQRKQDKAFEEAYRQAERLWQQPSAEINGYEPDVEQGWQRLHLKARMRTEAAEELVPVKRKRFPWAIAASIAFLLTLGIWFSSQYNQQEWIEVQTALNETMSIELPDGSSVSLNENSTLSYPESFQHDSREVRLNGEAFFEVQKAEGKRFTVFAQHTVTEVIGTAFYLRAYPEEEVKVQVTEGKVAFASVETEEAVFLTSGEEAVLGKNLANPVKQEIKDPNFQAWQSKKLVFNNTELDQLVRRLEQYFDTPIFIQNTDLRNCRFTVSFENPELEETLEIISITGNLTVDKKEGKYVISGTSCK